MRIVLFILSFAVLHIPNIPAQTEWERWNADEVSYELENLETRDYSIDEGSFGSTVLTGIRNVYWFFVSDVDGDNCPFQPSCSSFFVESVNHTNFFQGLLMFADRFTRDSNFYKNSGQYFHHTNGKYHDPAFKHTMNKAQINQYYQKQESSK